MQEQTFNNHLDTDPSSATNHVEGVEVPHPAPESNLDLINALLDLPPPENSADYNGSEQALKNMKDNDNPESILEITEEFSDFRDYMYHAFFPSFLNVWCEFRRAKIWAKHPEKIPEVQGYLGELRASIIILCLHMVLSHTNNEHGTSRHESFLLFSAVKKLDREIEKAQYVFSIIEKSPQGPAEAIVPLMQFSDELGAKVNQILDPNYKFDTADDFALFYDSKIRNLCTDELQAMARDTFNRSPFQDLDLNYMQTSPGNVKVTEYKQQSEPLQNNVKQIELRWIQEDISQFCNPKKTGRSQSKQPATHGKPSSKPPVINNPPYNEQTIVQYINPFMILSGSNNAAHPQPTFPSNHSTSNPSQLELEESETEIMEKYISFGEDEEDGSEYKQDCCDDDDKYIQKDSEHDDTLSDEPPRKKQKALCGNAKNIKSATKKTPTSEGVKKKRKVSRNRNTKRTQTSYEPHITAYLMTMFFEVYSVRSKLTKAERQAAHEFTNISHRNLTYWFSNRKRRDPNDLEEYKKLVSESTITCYKDYLEWQDAQDLEEE